MKLTLHKKPLRPGMLLAALCLWGAFIFSSLNFFPGPALAQTEGFGGSCSPSPVLTAGTAAGPAENGISEPQTATEPAGATEKTETVVAGATAEKEEMEAVTTLSKDALQPGASKAEVTVLTTEDEGESEEKETAVQSTVILNDEDIKEKEILVFLDGLQIVFDVQPTLEKDRLLVPFRALFEAMRAQVSWDNASKTVTAGKGGRTLQLTVNQQEALLNGEIHTLDVPPLLLDNRVLVPLRFIGEFFGELQVNWVDGEKKVYLETGLAKYRYLERKFAPQAKEAEKAAIEAEPGKNDQSENAPENDGMEKDVQTAQNDSFVVGVHTVELSPSLDPKVSLAQGQIGKATSLHNFASYFQNPVAIINGTYFNPTGKYPDPYGTIITEGKIVHTGEIGTTIGFTAEKEIRIADLDVEIKGTVMDNDLLIHNWGGFGLNHTPTPDNPSIYIFTAARGKNIGFDYGTAVLVDKNGVILDCVQNVNATIPSGGFVLTFTEYLQAEALQHFLPGRQVAYEIILKDKEGNIVDWSDIQEAFTCWPLIVKDGQIVAPVSKVPAIRSALAIRPDGRIILISSTPATLGQLGTILQEDLGVSQAINLDGGGSAGLYLHGLSITKPSRLIPNALVFYKR